MKRLLLALCLPLTAYRLSLAVEAQGLHWNEQSTQHFDIRYRSAWMPGGMTFTLESIHQKLEFNIGILNPSLLQEKKRFVLYKDRKEYIEGAFKPPPWSVGIAYPSLRALVMYETPDVEEFRTTMAHEMTHLIVGTYFREKKARAPRWLDEGLAMLMEERAIPVAKKDLYWQASRALLPRDKVRPVAEFQNSEPKADADKDEVRDWYFQAYLMTRWLFLEHSKLQFKSLCDALRDGQDLRYALQKVYGLAQLEKFDEGWTRYAGLPETRPQEKAGPKGFQFKPADFAGANSKPKKNGKRPD